MATSSSDTKTNEDQMPTVECKSKIKNLWLVKVPKYLSKAWEEHPGQEVGTLKVQSSDHVVLFSSAALMNKNKNIKASAASAASTSGLTARQRLSLDVQPMAVTTKDSAVNSQLPDEHQFIVHTQSYGQKDQTLSDGQTLAVISEDKSQIYHDIESKQGVLSVEGRIARRAECRPNKNSRDYMHLKKKAIETVNKPKNKIVQIDRAEQKFKPMDIHREQLMREKQKRDGAKAVRVDREKLLNILFELFEKHQYYKLVDLQSLTKQPPGFLKEVLNEIAHYNTAPPHRSMWELKPEYRAYEKTESMDSSNGDNH